MSNIISMKCSLENFTGNEIIKYHSLFTVEFYMFNSKEKKKQKKKKRCMIEV